MGARAYRIAIRVAQAAFLLGLSAHAEQLCHALGHSGEPMSTISRLFGDGSPLGAAIGASFLLLACLQDELQVREGRALRPPGLASLAFVAPAVTFLAFLIHFWAVDGANVLPWRVLAIERPVFATYSTILGGGLVLQLALLPLVATAARRLVLLAPLFVVGACLVLVHDLESGGYGLAPFTFPPIPLVAFGVLWIVFRTIDRVPELERWTLPALFAGTWALAVFLAAVSLAPFGHLCSTEPAPEGILAARLVVALALAAAVVRTAVHVHRRARR